MQIENSLLNFSNYTKARFSNSKKTEKEIREEKAKMQDFIQKKYAMMPDEEMEPELSVELDTYEVTEEDRINIKVNFIAEKLKSGAELSDKEIDLLSKHSPAQYELAIAAKKEREEFEREAKNCKTKDDVRKLKNKKDSKFLTKIKIAEEKGEKGEALKQITLLAQVTDEHKQFLKTKDYRELPDKSENELFTIPSYF